MEAITLNELIECEKDLLANVQSLDYSCKIKNRAVNMIRSFFRKARAIVLARDSIQSQKRREDLKNYGRYLTKGAS